MASSTEASSVGLPTFTGVYVFGDSLVDPGNALKGAVLILAGMPVYWFWRRRA